MKKLTSSIYTFEKLINNNFLYVDKTEYIWRLVDSAPAMYFMSRPRRFGKSLTLSTLAAVFSGKKELFKDLAIYDKLYDWKVFPIIHLDMGNCNAKTSQDLDEFISDKLRELAQSAGVNIQGKSNATRLESLITELYKQGPVVILLDEYDKPILNNIGVAGAKDILSVLKGFYSTIKTCESLEHFVFVTGVTKFCHVSLFSDLNNLTDITMDANYATMLGYTQSELENAFSDRIGAVEKQQSIPHDDLIDKIKNWYNGYRFEETIETVYNPVSLASFFTNNGKFHNYWFSTGTPTFLLDVMKNTDFDFENALTHPVSGLAFDAYEIDKIEPLALLLQTGYLTIKSAFNDFGVTFYQLDFPNFEVRSAFDTYLMNTYTSISKDELEGVAVNLARCVRGGDVDSFMSDMQKFFAAIPYDIQIGQEKYYQTIFFLLFLMLGVYIEAESRTNSGRIDAVACYGEWVYIFEFKMNQTAEIALAQIREKEYFKKYQNQGKTIILIGANFDTRSRQISDWEYEEAK
ncbi:MAG: ATP-binding protein [Victivallales bacterium]|nr:ATP-binding protein [Victivallales bacterium]